jgi:hypothetical protein
MLSSLFGSFDAKVVAMPAEIFMVRLEAEARLLEEVLPSSRSRFIPYTPRSQFAFKQLADKDAEAPSEKRDDKGVR